MGTPTPKPVTQTNTVKLGPEQKQVFDLAFPSIQAYANSTPQLFPGTGIAGFSPWEQQAQQSALGAVPTASGLATGAAGAQSKLLDPNFMLNPNQYVTGAMNSVTQQVTDNLQRNILPAVRTSATMASGPDAHTSKEGIATGLAIGETNKGLSQALSDMLLRNYTQGLGTMSSAIAQNPSVIQQQLMPANIMSGVGGQQRAMEQAGLDEQIRQFYAQQDLPLSRAQQLLNLISGMPGGSGVSTVTPSTPQANPWMQGLGLGMTALGFATGNPMMAMSGMSGAGMGK